VERESDTTSWRKVERTPEVKLRSKRHVIAEYLSEYCPVTDELTFRVVLWDESGHSQKHHTVYRVPRYLEPDALMMSIRHRRRNSLGKLLEAIL
jgi:hypothetical protein